MASSLEGSATRLVEPVGSRLGRPEPATGVPVRIRRQGTAPMFGVSADHEKIERVQGPTVRRAAARRGSL